MPLSVPTDIFVRPNRHHHPPRQTSSSTPADIFINSDRHHHPPRQTSSSTPTDIIVHSSRHITNDSALWVPREPCISHACVAPRGHCDNMVRHARPICRRVSRSTSGVPHAEQGPRSGVSPYWRVCAPDGQGLSCAYACSWE